jgi:hypothetical protein
MKKIFSALLEALAILGFALGVFACVFLVAYIYACINGSLIL